MRRLLGIVLTAALTLPLTTCRYNSPFDYQPIVFENQEDPFEVQVAEDKSEKGTRILGYRIVFLDSKRSFQMTRSNYVNVKWGIDEKYRKAMEAIFEKDLSQDQKDQISAPLESLLTQLDIDGNEEIGFGGSLAFLLVSDKKQYEKNLKSYAEKVINSLSEETKTKN